jgi:ADP-ribosyl-[dinitrogen reductase] hydrolase
MGAPPLANSTPLRNSYWVLPGKVLAGEHPTGTNREATLDRLQRLIDAGVECFIDLTEPGEHKRYDADLPFTVEYLRKPIKDHGIPSKSVHMAEILDCLHDALNSGRCVYVHCRAGIGRTGTVIGCFLVERGLAGEAALNELNRLWQYCERSNSWPSVPETDEQSEFVRRWKPRSLFDRDGKVVAPALALDDDLSADNGAPWSHLLTDSRAAARPTTAPRVSPHAAPRSASPAPGAAPSAAGAPFTPAPSTAIPPGKAHFAPGAVAPAGSAPLATAPATAIPAGPAPFATAPGAAPSAGAAPFAPAPGAAGPAGSAPFATAPGAAPPAVSAPFAIAPGAAPPGGAAAFAPARGAAPPAGNAPFAPAPGAASPAASPLFSPPPGVATTGAWPAVQPADDTDPLLTPEALTAARNLRDRFLGALIGLAIGDAVAAATQYRRPGSFTPVGDMLGGGPFELPRGAWTDDTAMALCLAESLLERDGFDARDQIERYRRWQQQGYLSATGQCVGITASSARAIAMAQWRRQAFFGSHDPSQLDPEPLARVAPVVLFFFAASGLAIEQATEAARTTCQAPVVLDACRSLARALYAALTGQPKAVVLEKAVMAMAANGSVGVRASAADGDVGFDDPAAGVSALIAGVDRTAPPATPGTGAGAAAPGAARADVRIGITAPAALTAAIAAFGATNNFRDAILYAANLGGDSDVVAAVCGQLAGAYYGVKAIPTSWHNSLMHKELITSFCDRLLAHAMLGLSG